MTTMKMMTVVTAAAALAALAGGCSLDPSSKPVCIMDDDCHDLRGGHCVEATCVPDVIPTAVPDVIYVTGGATHVEGEVVANDVDPDGDPLVISTAYAVTAPGTYHYIDITDTRQAVALDVPATLPALYRYALASPDLGYNATIPPERFATITVANLPAELAVPVAPGGTVDLGAQLAAIPGSSAAAIELVTAPTAGTLTGDVPSQQYTASSVCGDDLATYRLHAANGAFDLPVRLHVGVVLTGETETAAFGSPHTFEVLANDADATLELVAVSAPFATIASDRRSLVVDPPSVQPGGYQIQYTARDARGCTGTATLTLDVQYRTEVLVGAGLTGDAFDPAPSFDGRYIAFTSGADSLVPEDTNAAADVFVLDVQTNTIERVSVDSMGAQANDASGSPSISADGRWVAFTSHATNLAAADVSPVDDVYLHDRTTGTTVLVSVSVDGAGSDQPSTGPQVSDDGMRVVFASTATRLVDGDTNGTMDVFLRDRAAGTTTRVSRTAQGAQSFGGTGSRPRISGDGRYVVLVSTGSLDSSNNTGTFVVDTLAVGSVTWLAYAMGTVDIDRTGRHVAYRSSYLEVLDRQTGVAQQLGGGDEPSLSGSGQFTAFAGTGGTAGHVLVARGPQIVDVLVSPTGEVVLAPILRRPALSGDGRWVVVATSAWPGYEGRFVIVRVWNRAGPA